MKTRPSFGQIMPASAVAVVTDNESLIREYLEWKETYTQRAAQAYAIWVKRFQAFVNKIPEAITLSDWTEFARSLRDHFAPKSITFGLSIIRNYLRFWYEQGRLLSLPLFKVRVPAAMAQSHHAITEDEYQAILESALRKGNKGLRDAVILMLLHDTGMRVGELTALEIEQMEEDASAIIRSEKTVQRRRIFWNHNTDVMLHRYIVQRINRGAQTDWLFASSYGVERRLANRGVQHVVRSACAAAGIDRKLSPHSFRHAYIHRLAALGTPDAIIAQLVGHSTPHTISHYTKLSRTEFEQAARRQFQESLTPQRS